MASATSTNVLVYVEEDSGDLHTAKDDLLGISSSLLYMHKDVKKVKYVEVSWNFENHVNLIDWIGMYQASIFYYIVKKNFFVNMFDKLKYLLKSFSSSQKIKIF